MVKSIHVKAAIYQPFSFIMPLVCCCFVAFFYHDNGYIFIPLHCSSWIKSITCRCSVFLQKQHQHPLLCECAQSLSKKPGLTKVNQTLDLCLCPASSLRANQALSILLGGFYPFTHHPAKLGALCLWLKATQQPIKNYLQIPVTAHMTLTCLSILQAHT